MPLGHRTLSIWYRLLAQQLEAGLPFADAVRSARGAGLPAAGLDAMARCIEAGGSIDAALAVAERWLPQADRLVLAAAAQAGRQPRTLHALAARHAQLGAAKLRLTLACAYPLATLHAGLLLLPILRTIDWEKGFTWDSAAYARALALTIGPLWGAIALLWILARRQNATLARVARRLPFLGGYFRAQGLADFAFALGNFLDAGMLIDRAWSVAGTIATLPEVKSAAAALHGAIARGERPGAGLVRWPCFPPEFVALYRSGEATGQLEQNLFQLATQFQERANRSLTLATLFYPGAMFVIVAALVIYHVVTFYAGYLNMIEKLAS